MREKQFDILGKEFTFDMLPLKKRTTLKMRLAHIGLKDFKLNEQAPAVLGKVLDRLGHEGARDLLVEIARMSIVAPSNFAEAKNDDQFFEELEKMEIETGKDGNIILWVLAFESLGYQLGGMVDSLGKKSTSAVDEMRSFLKEKLNLS